MMEVAANSRAARKEARLRRLVTAALEEFAERGYHLTSVDDIVARARASKTTFYEFFASKEDCVRHLLEYEADALMQAVTQAAAAGTDSGDRVRRGIRGFVTACDRDRSLARLLLVESVGLSDEVEAARRAVQGRFHKLVSEEARRSAARGTLAPEVDPDLFGWAVVGAVSEATAHLLAEQPGDPERLIAGLCRIFAP